MLTPFISRGFYSLYFLILKKLGGLRPILDLRLLNIFIRKTKFRMVTLISIILSLPWFAALNMKDTHFHINIHVAHHRFLLFYVGNNHYQFKVLPFGIASASPLPSGSSQRSLQSLQPASTEGGTLFSPTWMIGC